MVLKGNNQDVNIGEAGEKMKKAFKEYYQFTEEELKELWETCLFVFDANILLNMYRYGSETAGDYFKVLEELNSKKQIWIPHQVASEFFENRISVIHESEKSYEDIKSILFDEEKSIINKIREKIKQKKHPLLDLGKIEKEISAMFKYINKTIDSAKEKHPKLLRKDLILDKISQLFDGNVGIKYDDKRINEIIEEGKYRYSKEIPPGYKDNNKVGDKKYGDLILWLQIIDKAQEAKKPIIFISDDFKEDWWLIAHGQKIMPRPQLKKEILEKANVNFHIYSAELFLEFYNKNKTSKNKIDSKTIREVKEVQKIEENKTLLKENKINIKSEEPKSYVISNHLIDYVATFREIRHWLRYADVNQLNKEDAKIVLFRFDKFEIMGYMYNSNLNMAVLINYFSCIEQDMLKLKHLIGTIEDSTIRSRASISIIKLESIGIFLKSIINS